MRMDTSSVISKGERYGKGLPEALREWTHLVFYRLYTIVPIHSLVSLRTFVKEPAGSPDNISIRGGGLFEM